MSQSNNHPDHPGHVPPTSDKAPTVRESTALDHRSTGPNTAAGKARSSKNALRHGLYSSEPHLPGEDLELYEIFVMGFYESLDPGPGIETVLAHRLADLAWRLRRAAGAEIDIYKPDTHPLPPRGTPLIWLGGPEAPRTLEAPALPPDATPGQVYLYRLRTDGDPFRGLSRHGEYLHRQFCRDLASFHTLRKIRLDREAHPPPGRPRNPYHDRRDKHGEVIGRFSTRPDHARLWNLEVELGLHDRDGNLPDAENSR